MENTSFLSRFVEPVVGFLKTVPSTICDGFTEVADAVSPAKKRRRTSDSSTYHPRQPSSSPPHLLSPEKSFNPQPNHLRLSDASVSNAAGPSVATPAAFQPAQDLLAAATSPMHPNPQILMRDTFVNQTRPSLTKTPYANQFSSPNPTNRFSTPMRRLTTDLDFHNFFHYPFPSRRSSLTGLRGIWPSDYDPSESSRRSSISLNHQMNAAQLYWQRVDERRRAKVAITSVPKSKTYASSSSPKGIPCLSQPLRPHIDPPERRSLPHHEYSHTETPARKPTSRAMNLSPTQATMRLRLGMKKKKRVYNEQRLRRSHQASVKKFAAATAFQGRPYSTGAAEGPSQLASETAKMKTTSDTVPMPFIEILEEDSILGQKLLKMHGAALTRLVKSQNRSRHRQLECWLAEQDLKQIQRKREEVRRLNAIESQIWRHAEDPSQQPPDDKDFKDVDYWSEEDPDWDEEMDDVATVEREKQITVAEENSAFASLSRSAVKRLRAAMNDNSNHYEALAKIDGCVIRGEDLRRLRPNCWLNDEIVNAYLALLTVRTERLRRQHIQLSPASEFEVPNVKIMNSFFYSKLVQFDQSIGRYEYNYARVRRWTRRFDVFSFDAMLIPINEQNVHWTLGVIDFRTCRVEHLDSMGTGGSPSVREFLMRWLQDEAEDKQKSLNVSKWKAVERRVPIQENTDDCGVFLCKYADFICRGWKKFTFSQKHMNYFRARIAHELLMGKA